MRDGVHESRDFSHRLACELSIESTAVLRSRNQIDWQQVAIEVVAHVECQMDGGMTSSFVAEAMRPDVLDSQQLSELPRSIAPSPLMLPKCTHLGAATEEGITELQRRWHAAPHEHHEMDTSQ